jgi:hypothetical protein
VNTTIVRLADGSAAPALQAIRDPVFGMRQYAPHAAGG